MKDNCHSCCTGEPPEKQPDVPIEEIEQDMRRMRSPSQMDEFAKWLDERPLLVKKAARDFPPWQMYLVKERAPYRYTCAGSIVSALSFVEVEKTGLVDIKFRVLRSPIGHAGVVAVIDPQYLEPITLDDLKEQVDKEERISAGELRAMGAPIGDEVPDCASVPLSAISEKVTGVRVEGDELIIDGKLVFAEPLKWITFTFTVPEDVDADELVRDIQEEIDGEVPVYGAPILKEDG